MLREEPPVELFQPLHDSLLVICSLERQARQPEPAQPPRQPEPASPPRRPDPVVEKPKEKPFVPAPEATRTLTTGAGVQSARLHERNPKKVCLVFENGRTQIMDLALAVRQGYVIEG